MSATTTIDILEMENPPNNDNNKMKRNEERIN